jgi:peptidoglycan LD-endopeptidase CwlK
MARNVCSLCLGLLIVAIFGLGPDDKAWGKPGGSPRGPAAVSANPLDGPGVYARIPARDEYGRDQLAMFRAWNPDPVGNHEANLRALNPQLANVVRGAQTDNLGLRFVIGSGRRDGRLQGMALAWGWSRTRDSLHRTGDAVDLWPLDCEGHVDFNPQSQNRIAAAMRKSAAELGVAIRWGGHFHRYKHMDRSHFELVPP